MSTATQSPAGSLDTPLTSITRFTCLQAPEVKLAGLMVEAVAGGGNTGLIPDGDEPTQTCAALFPAPDASGWDVRYAEELQAWPVLGQLLSDPRKVGADAVYDWADLKAVEATALSMHHTGFMTAAIAFELGRQVTAVEQLVTNGAWKLERALRVMAPVNAEPHCALCQVARDLFLHGQRPILRLTVGPTSPGAPVLAQGFVPSQVAQDQLAAVGSTAAPVDVFAIEGGPNGNLATSRRGESSRSSCPAAAAPGHTRRYGGGLHRCNGT